MDPCPTEASDSIGGRLNHGQTSFDGQPSTRAGSLNDTGDSQSDLAQSAPSLWYKWRNEQLLR